MPITSISPHSFEQSQWRKWKGRQHATLLDASSAVKEPLQNYINENGDRGFGNTSHIEGDESIMLQRFYAPCA